MPTTAILHALGWTIVIECLAAVFFSKCLSFAMPRFWWVIIVLMNVVSHPMAYVLVGMGAPWLLVEMSVVVFEIFVVKIFFAQATWRTATLFSLTLNVISAVVGLLLYR